MTQVSVAKDVHDMVVRVSLPNYIVDDDYQTEATDGSLFPDLEVNKQGRFMAWRVDGEILAGTVHEYKITMRVAPTEKDVQLISIAAITAHPSRTDDKADDTAETVDGSKLQAAKEQVQINVFAKGAYLRHLPALYDSDDFMRRYVMLFESFWKPIETQIDHLPYYFDCQMTPTDFLPVLAWWLSLDLDDRWSEEQQRTLVCMIIKLYRKRGTLWGLSKFLEIYTGSQPQIIEHRARNFTLGRNARLGQSVALGQSNRPHTFTVKLALPPIPAEDEQAQERQELKRRQMIEQIIEFEKPAHTGYELVLEAAES